MENNFYLAYLGKDNQDDKSKNNEIKLKELNESKKDQEEIEI